MKKVLCILVLVLFSICLSSIGGEYCVGTMYVKISFENGDSDYCYISIHSYDFGLLKSIGIDDDDKMYKLEPMTDITQFLSNKADNREVAYEIFTIPNKLSVIPESKLVRYNSLGNVAKVEYIHWMGRISCEVYRFITVPDEDIERMRNCNEIHILNKRHGEFMTVTHYVLVNDALQSRFFRLLFDYSYWEVYFNQLGDIEKVSFDKFYWHFRIVMGQPNIENLLIELQLYDYFMYLNDYYQACTENNSLETDHPELDLDKLKDLYSKAIKNHLVVYTTAFD